MAVREEIDALALAQRLFLAHFEAGQVNRPSEGIAHLHEFVTRGARRDGVVQELTDEQAGWRDRQRLGGWGGDGKRIGLQGSAIVPILIGVAPVAHYAIVAGPVCPRVGKQGVYTLHRVMTWRPTPGGPWPAPLVSAADQLGSCQT